MAYLAHTHNLLPSPCRLLEEHVRLAELKITTEKRRRDEQQAEAEFSAQAEQVRQPSLWSRTLVVGHHHS